MIDISTVKLLTLFAGISMAAASFVNVMSQVDKGKTEPQVSRVIKDFVAFGNRGIKMKLDSVLHPHFRVVANQLNGTKTLALIGSIEVVETNAAARITLRGKSEVFPTFYHLVRTDIGE